MELQSLVKKFPVRDLEEAHFRSTARLIGNESGNVQLLLLLLQLLSMKTEKQKNKHEIPT